MLKRCAAFLNRLRNSAYVCLMPVEKRWRVAQARYARWANAPLSDQYLGYVQRVGSEFAAFVGEPTQLVDVGCGNGVYAGLSYAEAGYIPIHRGRGYVLGVDPLPLLQSIPWISEFKQGKIEEMKLSGFSEASFVTTFDHIAYPNSALKSLKRAGVTKVFLWETLYKRHTSGDQDHPHHYTYAELESLFKLHGFKFTQCKVVRMGDVAEEWFIEANLI